MLWVEEVGGRHQRQYLYPQRATMIAIASTADFTTRNIAIETGMRRKKEQWETLDNHVLSTEYTCRN